jgi:hypothetical protein
MGRGRALETSENQKPPPGTGRGLGMNRLSRGATPWISQERYGLG